jgi:hypothetical protein
VDPHVLDDAREPTMRRIKAAPLQLSPPLLLLVVALQLPVRTAAQEQTLPGCSVADAALLADLGSCSGTACGSITRANLTDACLNALECQPQDLPQLVAAQTCTQTIPSTTTATEREAAESGCTDGLAISPTCAMCVALEEDDDILSALRSCSPGGANPARVAVTAASEALCGVVQEALPAPVCCDADGDCADGDDDWCFGEGDSEHYFCSRNSAAYAASMGGVYCPADFMERDSCAALHPLGPHGLGADVPRGCVGTADAVPATCSGTATTVAASCVGVDDGTGTACALNDESTACNVESADCAFTAAVTPVCDFTGVISEADPTGGCPSGCALAYEFTPVCDTLLTTDGIALCPAGCDDVCQWDGLRCNPEPVWAASTTLEVQCAMANPSPFAQLDTEACAAAGPCAATAAADDCAAEAAACDAATECPSMVAALFAADYDGAYADEWAGAAEFWAYVECTSFHPGGCDRYSCYADATCGPILWSLAYTADVDRYYTECQANDMCAAFLSCEADPPAGSPPPPPSQVCGVDATRAEEAERWAGAAAAAPRVVIPAQITLTTTEPPTIVEEGARAKTTRRTPLFPSVCCFVPSLPWQTIVF